jgi:hypothetical protein
MKGVSEAIAIIILLAISLSLAGSLFLFINSYYAHAAATVELIDSYCVNQTAYFVIRNGGTDALTKNSFICKKTDAGCSGNCIVDDTFPSGGAGYVKISGCSSGTHTFSLTGSANGLQMVVYCQ